MDESLSARIQEREQGYRLTIARLLDALERYPSDLNGAMLAASAELRRNPLWSELDSESES